MDHRFIVTKRIPPMSQTLIGFELKQWNVQISFCFCFIKSFRCRRLLLVNFDKTYLREEDFHYVNVRFKKYSLYAVSNFHITEGNSFRRIRNCSMTVLKVRLNDEATTITCLQNSIDLAHILRSKLPSVCMPSAKG